MFVVGEHDSSWHYPLGLCGLFYFKTSKGRSEGFHSFRSVIGLATMMMYLFTHLSYCVSAIGAATVVTYPPYGPYVQRSSTVQIFCPSCIYRPSGSNELGNAVGPGRVQ